MNLSLVFSFFIYFSKSVKKLFFKNENYNLIEKILGIKKKRELSTQLKKFLELKKMRIRNIIIFLLLYHLKHL